MRIGIASDHGGFELKVYLTSVLKIAGHEVVDFGAHEIVPEDDYPDFVVPMARAVASGEVTRGLAICGSGVGAGVAANKVPGVRAALITDPYSAHQGVEDDNVNLMCLGGRVTGHALAWDLVQTFMSARFKGDERFKRRLAKISILEKREEIMPTNPLKRLEALGQSVWLDYIRRDLMDSGKLKSLIKEDGLKGMTSNPSIFEKAIASSHDYDDDIRMMSHEMRSVKSIYEAISQRDVQSAADEFQEVYQETEGKDGYVSLEVNPHLAHNTGATIEEARSLWSALNRPNVLIKVPATEEGLPVIQQLISEGINVNVTLLFGLPRYRQVVDAYLSGIEARAADGKPINNLTSVASFFISRIDTLVDTVLEKLFPKENEDAQLARILHGQVAVSSAKEAYQIYKEIYSSDRFTKLADKGARPQRLLWASTSTKNPLYRDVKYIEELIGAQTVNTVPLETLEAYRDHGQPENRLERELVNARWTLQQLPKLGINIDQITQQLENEGVEKFSQSFDRLMQTLEKAVKNNPGTT